jgi:RNA polymerase sigma-70 factor (ECF subfamily)
MADASEQSVVWVRRLAAGEDEIVHEFWDRYGESLQRLAKSRMAPALQQRVGPDDIVGSVCRTFFRRARKGEFEIPGTDQLWRLLCAITLTKVRQHARFNYAIQRTPELEVPLGDESAGEVGGDARRRRPPEPTPAEAAEFAEAMQQLFAALTEEEQKLVHCRLEGLTQPQIAEKLRCSERTVRRLLDRIRSRWEEELESSLSQ